MTLGGITFTTPYWPHLIYTFTYWPSARPLWLTEFPTLKVEPSSFENLLIQVFMNQRQICRTVVCFLILNPSLILTVME